MNIHELDSYDLSDAVKFNDKLNPRIWGADEKMRPEVREQLLRIADDFREFLGIDVEVKDITVSGSNAAYTYTPHSDIDLHLVVDLPEADSNEVYRELFDAKKYAYNDMHDIKIGGYDVELYVQDANKRHHSQGIYSLMNNDWVAVPKRRRPDVDDISVKSKFEDLGHRIESAIKSQDYDKISAMAEKIREYRQAGLDAHGEFGPENLAFKILRTQGLIKQLYDARNEAKDELLSLDERRKKKKKKSVRYGYGAYWYPGTAYAGQDHPAGTEGGGDGGGDGGESLKEVSMTPDGTNPSTTMVVSDIDRTPTDEDILKDFVDFCAKELKIEQMPRVKLRRDPQWPAVHKTFGRYNDDAKTLEVAWGQRHIMDVLRTVAHELTHKHQHEREGHRMGPDAGETGSPYENEANARAGVLMRDYGRLHPEYFAHGQASDLQDVEEGIKDKVAAMAASACIAGTPGCSSTGQIIKTTQDVGRTAQTVGKMTRAGVQDELNQELRNFIRAQGGDPNAQNQSTLYKLQKPKQNKQNQSSVDESTPIGFVVPGMSADPVTAWKRQVRALILQYREDPTRLGELAKEKGKGSAEATAYAYLRSPTARIPLPPGAEVQESASGYIPTKKQAKDPRFSMALTVDIKPGQVGKEANKLKLKTDSQGHPQIARANGLFEDLYLEYKRYKAAEDYSPDEPPGPESKPTMPKGTLRVDVSDMYDWYKMGQHISNMKGLGKHDFGKGPPSTIISFGDEDTEHKFIGDIEATGLDVTDIDPADPKRRPGRKIKTDPTYNVNEDEDLDEVKMSPSALEKFAASPAAKGIRAGFEAELIFRDTQGESEELDPEPDYDADERAYSIQQVIEFFDNDEYGYGLSDRERNRLEEGLDETYMNWRDEKITSDFRDDAEDLIREKLLEETPLSERIHMYLTDSEQMSDEEADAVVKAGADAPKFTKSADQDAYTEQNPYYRAYLDAAEAAEAELEESVEYSVSRQDEYWDEALDEYRDNWNGDDDSFFSDVGLRWMSDIANEFNLDWPVWNMDARGNSGSRDWETIGALLQDAVDMPVKVSSNYHSAARREGQWIIEPDGSLSPDDPDDEAGLEIVSPPMPLLTAIEKLRAVTDWANNPKTGNAYTNSSTGLHMGVSLPTMKSEDVQDDIGIDYVKLILFMGDKYVQQQFGREANTYCASALDKLKQNIKGKRSDPAGVVKLLQHGLTELAYRELQKGVGTSKYTSAHIQPGYIEFRSPGGDWLAKADEEIGVLENTMLRFARAMAIAGDPNAERQEYAKKLYKLVTADNPEYADQLRLFSEFSAGTINKEQLKKQWADTVLQKELPGVGKEEYEVFRMDNKDSPDATVGTLYAKDYDDAYDQFMKQYGQDVNTSAYLDVRIKQPWFDVFDDTGKIVKTIRAKDADTATDRAQYEFGERWNDAWKIYRRPDDTPEPKASPRAQVAKRIAQPKSRAVSDDDASDWEAVYKPTGRVFDTLAHADTSQALAWRDNVMRSHGFTNVSDILVRRVGQQSTEQQARDANDVPMWEIYEKETGHVVHTFANLEKSSATTQANQWLRDIGTEQPTLFAMRAKMIPNQQSSDSRRDSADLQRSLGVRDVEPNIAQNFEPRRQNYELVSDEDPDRVIHRMPNATTDEVRAWIDQQEREGMPAGFLRTRIVAEAIDPISGAGAVPPRLDPKSTSKKTVEPVEKVFKQPVKSGLYKSAIGQAISQRDLENMTSQIQMARKLGDSVMEMEETPPEVMRALDQAAQKNGYKNWADVKANPRSENAVITVARLANTIMKTTGPHHEKIFYKSKTDENFADGKKPGRKGLSRRVGIPKKATLGQLEKIAKSSTGERRKMAQWQLNMRRGKAKKK